MWVFRYFSTPYCQKFATYVPLKTKKGALKRGMIISPGFKFDAVYIWGDQLNNKMGTVEPLAVPVALKPGEALDGVSRFELK